MAVPSKKAAPICSPIPSIPKMLLFNAIQFYSIDRKQSAIHKNYMLLHNWPLDSYFINKMKVPAQFQLNAADLTLWLNWKQTISHPLKKSWLKFNQGSEVSLHANHFKSPKFLPKASPKAAVVNTCYTLQHSLHSPAPPDGVPPLHISTCSNRQLAFDLRLCEWNSFCVAFSKEVWENKCWPLYQ